MHFLEDARMDHRRSGSSQLVHAKGRRAEKDLEVYTRYKLEFGVGLVLHFARLYSICLDPEHARNGHGIRSRLKAHQQ